MYLTDLLTSEFWGPDGPMGKGGPLLLLIANTFLGYFWALLARSISMFLSPPAFAWAALTTAIHFDFSVWEQYKIVEGIFVGVLFLNAPPVPPK
jgi:hypothetical protein